MKRIDQKSLCAGKRLLVSAVFAALMLPNTGAAEGGGAGATTAPSGRVLTGSSDLRGPSHDGQSEAGQGAPTGNGLMVSVPNGYASISVDDLRLQSVGGEVRWMRVWDGQEWKFNPHWESLSQSWKNLTGSQSADTTGATVSGESSSPSGSTLSSSSGSGGGGEGCWVWVDEDWQPSTGSVMIGGIPEAGPMLPVRTTPFNRLMGEDSTDYPPPQLVSVDYASLCVGSSISGGSSQRDTEGIRRLNELYLGDGGRYAFSNRAILEKRAVRQIPFAAAATLYAGLATGQMTSALDSNPKGYRWSDRSGDWIDYNTQGQAVAYGDRNDNVVWLVRDTDGVVRGVVDANMRVLLSLHYTGQLVTEVKDYPVVGLGQDLPGRSVRYVYDASNRLTQVIDARGNVTKYEYDAANRIVKVTDQEGRVEQLAYGSDVVKKRTAPDGGVSDYSFEYDDTNKQFISKITGPETTTGRRVEDFTHNRVGKLVRRIVNGRTEEEIRYDTGARVEISTNARGFITRTTKDEFEQVVGVTHPDGTAFKRTYSALHLELTEEVDEAGFKTQYQYDTKGNLLKKIEAAATPDQRVTEYTRNSLGQVIRITRKGRTESNGTVTQDAVWQLEYDALAQFKKSTDPEGNIRQYTYDRVGNLVSYTDPRGNITRYEVDAHGNLTKAIDALGRVRSYAYDKVGNLVTVTDALTKATHAAYDAMNRRTQASNPVGGVFKTQYNGQGLPVLEVDEDGRSNQTEYDNFLRVTKQVDAIGNAVRLGYQIPDGSAAGQLGSLSEPTEVGYPTFTQQSRFDERERPTSQTLKNSTSQGQQDLTSAIVYDGRGLVKSETDADGSMRTHSYDALGQRIETIDALGGKTVSKYDARGNLLQLVDANGNTHTFEYDRNSRVVKQMRPSGKATQYSYDAAGNLHEKTDPLGNRFAYTYDAANRLIEIKQFKADGALLRTTTQVWDANDNLTAWIDLDATRPAGQQQSSGSATFDDANRKTGETVNYPDPRGGSFVLSYGQAFSLAGKKSRLTWADGTVIDYAYSLHGELESVAIPGEGTITVNKFKWTAPEATTLPGGVTQNRAYDGLLNLEGFKVKTPGQQAVLDLNNVYGKVQELKSRVRTDSANGSSSTRSDSYLYDSEARLKQATSDAGGPLGIDTELFDLDPLGNRTLHSKQSGAWTYDGNNRLIRRGTGVCASAGVVCYDYDEAGNLLTKTEATKVTRYVYDAMNRLIEIRNGADQPIARYGYDLMDRRLWKEQFRDKSGTVLSPALRSYFLYTEEGLIAEATQPIELHPDGSVSSNQGPAITSQWGPAPGSEFTTGTLFVKTANSGGESMFAYFHHDHLNIPIQATDKAGNVVWSAYFDAFGKAHITTPLATAEIPTISSNLRLPGQYEDEETGLHYNFRRYYDSEIGRYISEDPIGLEGGFNLFLYANANPLEFTDPTGEWVTIVLRALPFIARVICVRNPKICKEIYKCVKNPTVCKNRFCRIMRSKTLYHPFCDVPSCDKMNTQLGRQFAEKAAQTCLALRSFVKATCFAGKSDPEHDREIENARRKVVDCARICRPR